MITLDDLRGIRALADLPESELTWLAEHTEERTFADGEVIFEQGSEPLYMYFVFGGGAFIRVDGGGTFAVEAGEISGMLPHSRMTEFGGTGRAMGASRFGYVHRDQFRDMLRQNPELEKVLIGVMADRIRETTRNDEQRERLVSLGTMSAGLAHELNNPASASKRAALALCETLQEFDELASRMLIETMFETVPDEDPFQPIYDILADLDREEPDPVALSELEDEMADWLEEQDVEEPWDRAATLAGAGIPLALLQDISSQIKPDYVKRFLDWVPRDVEMRMLSKELADATTRISELVTAMKSYSYMDQAKEKTDLQVKRGIIDTVIILKYKIKRKAIRLEKVFNEVPAIHAHGGALNQVWTNILDNAIYAVPDDGGVIRIETSYSKAADCVSVTFTDNGPGIPEDVQRRMFEPFFTTKGVGEGTGLGLDVTHRIVVRQHKGKILVDSEPGRTSVEVQLPVK
ncbi:MAG: ATP-binding protein [Bacteroidota bacterium]